MHITGRRGSLSVQPMFRANKDMNISNPDQQLKLVIREFLKIGEAVAACSIYMPRGVLLLQSVPGDPASGAIYLYDRAQKRFYRVHFDGPDDNLTLADFEELMEEYRLLDVLENPRLLQSPEPVATA